MSTTSAAPAAPAPAPNGAAGTQPAAKTAAQAAKPAVTTQPGAQQVGQPSLPDHIVVDGQQVPLTPDLLAEFYRQLPEFRKGKAGDLRLSRAAEERKKAEEMAARVKAQEEALKDPDKLIEQLVALGHDRKALGEKLILEFIQERGLSEAEKEARALKRQLEEIQAKDKQRQEAESAAKKRAAVERARDKYYRLFADVLVRAGLAAKGEDGAIKPDERAAWAIQRMALAAKAANAGGMEATPDELLSVVAQDLDAGASLRMADFHRRGEEGAVAMLEWLEARHPGTVKFLQQGILARHRQNQATPAVQASAAAERARAANGQFARPEGGGDAPRRPRDTYELHEQYARARGWK